MKIILRLLLASSVLTFPCLSMADEVDGTSLNISGEETEAAAANYLDGAADGSAVFGIGNDLEESYSGVFGFSNAAAGGGQNLLNGEFSAIGTSYDSFATGQANSIHSALACFAAGINNDVTNSGQIALGYGIVASLSTGGTAAVIVGNYNLEVTNQLFVVGNGTGSGTTPRRNAMEVYKDGTVKILKRQGNVGMGRFTTVTADQ